jgi:hypothetical protein
MRIYRLAPNNRRAEARRYAQIFSIQLAGGKFMSRAISLVWIMISFLLFSPAARAQEAAAAPQVALEARLKALEERLKQVEAELAAVKSAAAAQPAPVAAAPAPMSTAAPVSGGPQLPVYGGASASAAKVFNPDISLIGNFLSTSGKNPVNPSSSFEMAESELGLRAIIDPYVRGDVFLAFGESGVELEEGYFTFTSLPGGFVARVGKMRAEFGKVNLLHTHNLPWTDRPLVTDNLLGGEEGLSDAGLSVSRILPAPGGLFLEGTLQLYRGESSDVFSAPRRHDVAFIGRLRGYKDLTDSSNVDLGFSYGRGNNDEGLGFKTDLFGLDATFRWKPLRRAIYNSFLARAEFVWSHREQPGRMERAFGFYASGEYRVNRRWTVGARYDRSNQARNAFATDSGVSALLTYWPSEFSQIRGQYRFTRYDGRQDANELRLQFLFVMGAHGAHPF